MDPQADFRARIEPHRRELLAHCYRVTGSLADADDALQEALVRAWKGLASFEGRSSFRRWLYTIATRTSLDLVDKRKARSLPLWTTEPGDPVAPPPPPLAEPLWLEPIPDDLLVDDAPGPEAVIDARESVRLAFLAALQTLPPRQRGALILKDVAGYSAEETAAALEMTVPAVNSALQRARETLASAPSAGARGPGQRATTTAREASDVVVDRFVRAFESHDAGALAALLRADAAFSMPPMPLWIRGRDAVRAFADGLFRSPLMADVRCVPTRANGAPAFATYARAGDGAYHPAGLTVLTLADDGLAAALHAFVGPFDAPRFGLPSTLPGAA